MFFFLSAWEPWGKGSKGFASVRITWERNSKPAGGFWVATPCLMAHSGTAWPLTSDRPFCPLNVRWSLGLWAMTEESLRWSLPAERKWTHPQSVMLISHDLVMWGTIHDCYTLKLIIFINTLPEVYFASTTFIWQLLQFASKLNSIIFLDMFNPVEHHTSSLLVSSL